MALDPTAPRPNDYPQVDTLDHNSAPLPLAERGGGFTKNQIFTSAKANALYGAGGNFDQLRDEREVAVPEVLSTATAFRLTAAQLAYSGPRMAATPDTEPVYVLEGGVRLNMTGARMGRLGLSVVNFTASEFTWIYAGLTTISGVEHIDIQFDEVGAAVGPTPPAGYSAIVRVDTDATNITNLDYTDAPAHEVVADAVAWEIATLKSTIATLQQLIIDNVPSLTIGLNVTGAGDARAVEVDGGGDIAIAAQNSSALPTVVGQNLGTGQGVFAGATDAGTCALKAENTSGCAVEAVGAGSDAAMKVDATGTGSAIDATNDDPTAAAMVVTNNDAAGPGLTVTGLISAVSGITGGAGKVSLFDVYELASEKAASSDRQFHHLAGEPRYREDGGADNYLHHGTEPWGPVGSVPALDTAGPTSVEVDGPTVSVTLTGTAFIFVSAAGTFTGTAGDTEVGIRVEVDGVDIYDQSFEVFNTSRQLVWSTSFTVQEGAGTFDVKIKLRRSAGSGSVNLAQGAIFAMPT